LLPETPVTAPAGMKVQLETVSDSYTESTIVSAEAVVPTAGTVWRYRRARGNVNGVPSYLVRGYNSRHDEAPALRKQPGAGQHL
jgi:hypothetical protein